MEMRTILDTRYGSRINGTASDKSDDDTVFVFMTKEHERELPFSRNSDPEIRLANSRTGQPLWRFLRDCMIGNPLSADLLFLPPHAYILRPPEIIWDHRSIFLTQLTFSGYVKLGIRKRTQGLKANPKSLYHSLLYLNCARNLLKVGVPNYFDPNYIDTLVRVRNDRSKFEEEFQTLMHDIGSRKPDLPPATDWKLVDTIYQEVARMADEAPPETWHCGGCSTDRTIPPATDATALQHGSSTWWKERGPVLWEELHRWALSQYASDPRAWLDAFATRIPCGDCKQHWLDWAAANPPPSEMAEMFAWTVRGHNAVNERLKKDEITMAQAIERWAA